MTERKTFRAPIVLKADGDEGTFKSVFARFDVVDHDGDVTIPGAFENGQEVLVEGWNHDYGLPPGKGVIQSNKKEAWIEGAFFLGTSAGKEHYETLKALGGLEEWSYTFQIVDSARETRDEEDVRVLEKLDVWGVAPVTRGAGIGTRTVTLKAAANLSDEDVQQLKTLLKQDDDAGDSAEGEAGTGGPSDGKPSGGAPLSVYLALIEIEEAELDTGG